MPQLRSHDMAFGVHTQVEAAFQVLPPAAAQDYAGHAQELGFLVRENGLAQALAFLADKAQDSEGKSGAGAKRLLEDVTCRLGASVELIQGAPNMEYMRLTRAALEAAGWYKRFADTRSTSREPRQPEQQP